MSDANTKRSTETRKEIERLDLEIFDLTQRRYELQRRLPFEIAGEILADKEKSNV